MRDRVYLEFLDKTRGAYGEYVQTHVGPLIRIIRVIFGKIFDKMQFYFWIFLTGPEIHLANIFRQMLVP